ncbi:MAG: hypothetical protein HY791_23940 [Deltaproteobacteria bacterium]|nr:hypothetical protein [Deltaproteobacteria bacterium]
MTNPSKVPVLLANRIVVVADSVHYVVEQLRSHSAFMVDAKGDSGVWSRTDFVIGVEGVEKGVEFNADPEDLGLARLRIKSKPEARRLAMALMALAFDKVDGPKEKAHTSSVANRAVVPPAKALRRVRAREVTEIAEPSVGDEFLGESQPTTSSPALSANAHLARDFIVDQVATQTAFAAGLTLGPASPGQRVEFEELDTHQNRTEAAPAVSVVINPVEPSAFDDQKTPGYREFDEKTPKPDSSLEDDLCIEIEELEPVREQPEPISALGDKPKQAVSLGFAAIDEAEERTPKSMKPPTKKAHATGEIGMKRRHPTRGRS